MTSSLASEGVGSIQGRSSESPADVWAVKLAQRLEDMRNKASLSSGTSQTLSPNVTTSQAYTPTVVAQAASFQVYTQAGAVAAMSSGVGASAPVVADEHPDDIKAVEGARGSSVNTVA